jgi:hypothetical protein
MKQLISLFLFLLPCLALAQYPSNGNQKITLGEQTTADGLIWRGVLADTGIITPSSDTSAYIILDTVNHRFYNYNRATNVWSVTTIGSISSGLTGVLPLGNGGTGSATQNFVDLTTTQTVAGAKTFSSTITGARFDPTSSSVSGNGMYLPAVNKLALSTNSVNRFTIDENGVVLINTTTKPSVAGGGFFISRGNPSYTPSFQIFGGAHASVMYGSEPGFTFSSGLGSAGTLENTEQAIAGMGIMYISATDYQNFRIGTQSNHKMFFLTNNSTRITVDNDGDVGIGTSNPAVQFHTTSNVRFAGLVNYDPVETDADGDIIDGGASDFNLKNSIEPINYGLNSINQLKPVSYLWNDVNRKLDSTIPDIGFIAQDVMDVIPGAVRSNGDGDLQLNYKAITATLVKAIQEQQALIKALEQRIINLENK